jgi:hypothetical protein
MLFELHQRVRVKQSRWAFGGVAGTVANAPAFMAQLDPEPWNGHMQRKRRKGGVVLLYWIEFDQPADDGSGDGPYSAAAIEEEYLEPHIRTAPPCCPNSTRQ